MALDNTRLLTEPSVPVLLRPLMRVLRRLEYGVITIRLGEGPAHEIRGDQPGPNVHVDIRQPLRLYWNLLARGDIGFAESYMSGHWDTADLGGTLLFFALNEHRFSHAAAGNALVRRIQRVGHWLRRNHRRGSRRNIAHHYDLGNDFYRLWLDETMTYSCALFTQESETLHEAQTRKYQRMLDLLEARPGQTLLEIGCGWGGFAEHAAERGMHVDGITLSREQLAYARERIAARQLDAQVSLQFKDYRELDTTADHIVSIEMLEAVGESYWPTYFDTLKRCLRPGGRAAIQVITIAESAFAHYRKTPDFIQRYIFPGGVLPTVEILQAQAARAGLRVRALDRFGHDYARTLMAWDKHFVSARHEIRNQGFDERFYRMWRYYLHYCSAGFRTERIDLVQLALEHA